MKRIFAMWIDGACAQRTTMTGGWAVVCKFQGDIKPLDERSGSSLRATNNRAELSAAIMSLNMIVEHRARIKRSASRIIIYSDSKYVVDGLTRWLKNWKKSNWKSTTGEDVKNRDLWEDLEVAQKMALEAVSPALKKIEWFHVRGHEGNRGNERADELATEAVKKLDCKVKKRDSRRG